MSGQMHAGAVMIVDFPETKVAVWRHRGDPGLIGESVRKFVEWRREHGLTPSLSATYNILYDPPWSVDPEAFRLDLCAAVEKESDLLRTCGILCRTIPAGRCALLRHVGSDDALGESIRLLVARWLPASGESRRNYPVFIQRVRFFPEVPEDEAVIDIFLPIR
jgi:AraC family transcriptional regulator